MNLKLDDFDYQLPAELIASHPPKTRGSTNLLVLNRHDQTIVPKKYGDLIDYLEPGDCVVINQTKVIKARLMAKKQTGGERELILLENHGRQDDWFKHQVLYRRKLKAGDKLFIGKHELNVLETFPNGVAFVSSKVSLLDLCEQFGEPPLPPYMNRRATSSDVKRYQTVFAREIGSVAAPTASLNLTESMIEKMIAKGVKVVRLTLHVGLGTFLPIRVEDISQHQMHKEYFEIPKSTIAEIYDAKKAGRRVIAIGTTVVRTLEFAFSDIMKIGQKLADEPEHVRADKLIGEADIFIYPGYEFKMVDGMVTNYHAPRSTVLMMAAAFAGWDFLLQAYELAIARQYRFLSYGDSMLII